MVCIVWVYSHSKLRDKRFRQRPSRKSCKTRIKIFIYPGLFWTMQPWSLRYGLRLVQSARQGKSTCTGVVSSKETYDITLECFRWCGLHHRDTSQVRAELEVIHGDVRSKCHARHTFDYDLQEVNRGILKRSIKLTELMWNSEKSFPNFRTVSMVFEEQWIWKSKSLLKVSAPKGF